MMMVIINTRAINSALVLAFSLLTDSFFLTFLSRGHVLSPSTFSHDTSRFCSVQRLACNVVQYGIHTRWGNPRAEAGKRLEEDTSPRVRVTLCARERSGAYSSRCYSS